MPVAENDVPSVGPSTPVADIVKVDAIQFPGNYKSRSGDGRLAALETEARSIMGYRGRLYTRNHTSSFFMTASPHDSLYFPTWHDQSGQSRYDWKDRGDGVMLGTLVSGAAEAVGSTPPSA